MIAITGGNGLLGSFIIRKLIDLNEPFVAIKRENSDLSLLHDVKDKIEWRDGDILNAVFLDDVFKDVDQVVHAAALVSFNPRASATIFSVNVDGTRNIVNACLANGVKKLVHISSVSALGRLKGHRLINEDHKWTDNSLASTYAESKYLAELEVFRGQEEDLETVTLNPSVILAPANWTKSSAKLFKYVWDERRFYAESQFNFVDVRDVVQATVQVLKGSFSGERFIVNAGCVNVSEFFSKTATRFHKRPPNIKLNKTLLGIAAFGEGLRAWLSDSEPLLTAETARIAGTNFTYDNKKIKKLLNFKFQTLDQTLDWCCENYLRKFTLKK